MKEQINDVNLLIFIWMESIPFKTTDCWNYNQCSNFRYKTRVLCRKGSLPCNKILMNSKNFTNSRVQFSNKTDFQNHDILENDLSWTSVSNNYKPFMNIYNKYNSSWINPIKVIRICERPFVWIAIPYVFIWHIDNINFKGFPNERPSHLIREGEEHYFYFSLTYIFK